jgi:hypothetical protein
MDINPKRAYHRAIRIDNQADPFVLALARAKPQDAAA